MTLKTELTTGKRVEAHAVAFEPPRARVARGCGQALNTIRPRLLTCKALLLDAGSENLSLHARIRLGFECIYFLCLEVAASGGTPVDTLVHPSFDALDVALPALKLSNDDSVAVDLLLYWAQRGTPFLPAISVSEVCGLAGRIFEASLRQVGFD